MRARSLRLAAVVAVFALALVAAAVANASAPDRAATALDQAAAADANEPAADDTVAANKQSVQGNGQAQDDEVSTAQVGGEEDSGDKRVKKAATDRDCPDFEFQEDAQDYFDRNGGSEDNNFDNLDRDRDGLACEELPSRSGAPVGGPDTGGGGTAPPPDRGSSAGPLPFVLGGAAAGLLIALFGPSLRRRVTT